MTPDRGTCGTYSAVIANQLRTKARGSWRAVAHRVAGRRVLASLSERCDKNKSKKSQQTGITATMGITRGPADRRVDCAICRDLERHRHSWIELAPTRELLRYGCVVCYAKKTVKHPRPHRQMPRPADYSDPDFFDPTAAIIEGLRRLPDRRGLAPAVGEWQLAPRDAHGRKLN